MKQIVLTEEQYKRAVEEGVLPNNQPEAKNVINTNGGSVGGLVDQQLKKDPSKPVEVIDNTKQKSGTGSTSVWEGRVITKKELKENRLKKLRENSEIISVKEIFGV